MTSPEEMIAAAHSSLLPRWHCPTCTGEGGSTPAQLETKAEVDFQPGVGITEIRLHVRATYLA